jgi:hypothetical protein
MKEIIMTQFELIDLLNDFICPFLVVIYLIYMPMSIFSKATLTKKTIMKAISFRAVVSCLLLMNLAFLIYAFADILKFVKGGEFLSLHIFLGYLLFKI